MQFTDQRRQGNVEDGAVDVDHQHGDAEHGEHHPAARVRLVRGDVRALGPLRHGRDRLRMPPAPRSSTVFQRLKLAIGHDPAERRPGRGAPHPCGTPTAVRARHPWREMQSPLAFQDD